MAWALTSWSHLCPHVGSAAVRNLIVRASIIIIYSRKINAFDEIHLKEQQSSILLSPSDTTPFWKSLKALTLLEDLVANGTEVNDIYSDIMATYEPLICSYVNEKGLVNVQTIIDK